MKSTLHDVFVFIRFNHADAKALSESRAIMTAYLADWRSALVYGEQITTTEWTLEKIFDGSASAAASQLAGKYVLTGEFVSDNHLEWSTILQLTTPPSDAFCFSSEQRDALLHVIRVGEQKDISQFIRLVASTYPVLSQETANVPLNLVALAQTYKHLASA
ncbi:MAG: hypothetical protein ACTHQM_24475 [Thermoanaerobaculia bacterium]